MALDRTPPIFGNPARSTFVSAFALGDFVRLDGSDIIGRIVGFCWRREEGPSIEVSWLFNGDAKTAWFQEWRVTIAEPK